MSWEIMSRSDCGCEFLMDDFNNSKTIECESCKKKQRDEMRTWAIHESARTKECVDCLSLDKFGVHNDGPRYHTKGECSKCYMKRMHDLQDRFGIKDRHNKSEVLSSNLVKLQYKSEFPRSRGFNTLKFRKWAHSLMKFPRWYYR